MNFSKILESFSRHRVFIVATHVNPDPDALSSQLAVAMYLKACGKKVMVFGEDDLLPRYAFLPGASMIKKVNPLKKIDYDAVIVVDCGDLERVGDVEKIIDPQKPIINIDHHITNHYFGTINHVVPKASSTAEIIFEMFEFARFKIDKKIATLLYLGIMTDTGSFRFENTTSRTHEVVSQLLHFKLPVNSFYQQLYESVPLEDLQYFTKVVGGFRSYFDHQVLMVELRRSMLKKFSKEFDLRDKIFSYLRAIKGVEVIGILTEHGKNKTRVNFRSQHEVDVAQLAAFFNGGGHSRASGCIVSGDICRASEMILAQLKKVFKKKI
ncbi:MAG: bifunctional oligoribonuclease/PAP phosphatase NrnA [Candidatus Omnitrophica bacterium]|nr:bifunctional oligoribonuclease/PAP phosphatase NrnA [Candidatus Omnitrophota bacterium]